MNYTEIEIEWMKEILRDKEEYIKKLEEENKKLKKNIERYEKEETRYIKQIKNLEMIKKENESQISCYFKERDELRKENKKLKADSYNELQRLWLENYELREGNKKLKEETRAKESWRDLYRKECDKYEKLKADYIKLSKIVEIDWGYRASYVNELRDKIANLEQDLNIWKLTAKDYARLQWVYLEDSSKL